MPPVLLRVPRFDPFDLDPQSQPPHGQLAQPVEGMRGRKRDAVIGSNSWTTSIRKPAPIRQEPITEARRTCQGRDKSVRAERLALASETLIRPSTSAESACRIGENASDLIAAQ